LVTINVTRKLMEYHPPPGIYEARARVTISKDGTMVWQRAVFVPVADPEPKATMKLQNAWMNNSSLSYETFTKELIRQDLLSSDGKDLRLSGPQVKGTYFFLLRVEALPPDLAMSHVFELFSASFKLKFHSQRSLQSCDYDEVFFKKLFKFFRIPKNEIPLNRIE
jgi:hypothetical protein